MQNHNNCCGCKHHSQPTEPDEVGMTLSKEQLKEYGEYTLDMLSDDTGIYDSTMKNVAVRVTSKGLAITGTAHRRDGGVTLNAHLSITVPRSELLYDLAEFCGDYDYAGKDWTWDGRKIKDLVLSEKDQTVQFCATLKG